MRPLLFYVIAFLTFRFLFEWYLFSCHCAYLYHHYFEWSQQAIHESFQMYQQYNLYELFLQPYELLPDK